MAQSKPKFFQYAACSTCRKAKKWLDGHGVAIVDVAIVDTPPSEQELTGWIAKSGLPAHKWFNTSGQSYRALVASKGKPYVDALSSEQIAKLLSADGKLIKRPVLVTTKGVLVGFKEDAYEALFAK